MGLQVILDGSVIGLQPPPLLLIILFTLEAELGDNGFGSGLLPSEVQCDNHFLYVVELLAAPKRPKPSPGSCDGKLPSKQ